MFELSFIKFLDSEKKTNLKFTCLNFTTPQTFLLTGKFIPNGIKFNLKSLFVDIKSVDLIEVFKLFVTAITVLVKF